MSRHEGYGSADPREALNVGPGRAPFLFIAAALFLVTALHYGTPRDVSYHGLHDVWRRLYYIPIILGAFHYGLRGGFLTAGAVTLLYLPHVLFQWGGMAHGNQYIELLMFWAIGLVTGALAAELHRRRREARDAYAALADSFERMRGAERLAAMGQLSAALAHEIRNPLASIGGSLPILMEGIGPDDPRAEFGAIVRKELQRLDDLTSEFLAYARPPRPRWSEEELNSIVESVVQLVGKEAERSGVQVQTELMPGLPATWMDGDRMRQVVLNLVLNAVEAMSDGGVIRVCTGRDAEGLQLSVEDSGPGVDEEIREKIFEPFVSSKSSGTGLGLAVVHGWVKRHGGTIVLSVSELGGARFEVRLPERAAAPAATGDDDHE